MVVFRKRTQAIRLLEGVLSGGRTSRLFRSLVVNRQVALQVSFSSGFPGDKYPNLGLLFALPAQGVSIDTLASALREEIEGIKEEGAITDEELERVKVGMTPRLGHQLSCSAFERSRSLGEGCISGEAERHLVTCRMSAEETKSCLLQLVPEQQPDGGLPVRVCGKDRRCKKCFSCGGSHGTSQDPLSAAVAAGLQPLS